MAIRTITTTTTQTRIISIRMTKTMGLLLINCSPIMGDSLDYKGADASLCLLRKLVSRIMVEDSKGTLILLVLSLNIW